ncbi:MAG: hypothetical protein HGA78_10425 [Nitrospirales bacterium]|nr:hypothetical protein [Nitrospirales bacterium]
MPGPEERTTMEYEAALRRFFISKDENALFSVSEIARDLIRRRLGPDVLMDIHATALKEIIIGEDPANVAHLAVTANDVLLHAIMAYAMSYHALLDVLQAEKERLVSAYEDLEMANLKLRELDRLKSVFVASMSHKLRTPLNSIIGFTGIILQGMVGEISEEQRKQLTMVKENANDLRSLILDVIDVSKIEAGKAKLTIKCFDLVAVVRQVKSSFASAAESSGLSLSFTAPEELMIESDERRIRHVIINLMGNAVKFTHSGSVGITVAEKNDAIEISIRDTGIGIRNEDREKLFSPFSQIAIELRPTEGTGLGLYLSRNIARLLGGDITVESEYGKGSVFTFLLPLKFKEVTE